MERIKDKDTQCAQRREGRSGGGRINCRRKEAAARCWTGQEKAGGGCRNRERMTCETSAEYRRPDWCPGRGQRRNPTQISSPLSKGGGRRILISSGVSRGGRRSDLVLA